MLRPGFRLKLVCAMMAVVIIATGAALLAGQRRVRDAYERLSEQQFRSQFELLAELQETRLGEVKQRCLDLVVQSVRLRAALEENDAPLLYQVAADELRTLEASSARRSRPSSFLFFDAHGQLIPPPAASRQAGPQAAQQDHSRGMLLVRRTLEGSEAQQLGVAVLAGRGLGGDSAGGRDRDAGGGRADSSGQQLYELVVTRISGPDGGTPLGALLVAFPAVLPANPSVRTNAPVGATLSANHRLSQVRFGIWSDGLLYARDGTFPGGEQAELIRLIEPRAAAVAHGEGDFTGQLGGEPVRVIHQALLAADDSPALVGVYSLAESLREQARLRREVILFGTLALAGALVLSAALSHGLSVPIRDLLRGTAEVRRGNFAVKVPVRSPDELGQLAGAFNEMTAGLELKERYRTVLNTVADEKVARQLLDGGLALGGEVRPVTMLFCDIRGFTAHTENMAPTETVEMLNEHMTALTRVVKEQHGVLDKFVGDLLMALFGAPLSRGSDALDAARSALGIIAERHRLNGISRHRLQVGIGLATGQVVAGCMGSADRLNYTVIGERVNLASRLCSLAKPGQVVMDDLTRAALGDAVEVRALPPVRLKGFTGEVQAFELVAMKEAETAPAQTEVNV